MISITGMFNDFLNNVNLITNKHSSSGYILWTGNSGTHFNNYTEDDIKNKRWNNFKWYASANSNDAGIYITRIDGKPLGDNNEMTAVFHSGYYQGTHGWPCSGNVSIPKNADEYIYDNNINYWKLK